MMLSERLLAASGRVTLGLSWPLLLAAAAFLALLAQPARLLNDADVYWHVAAGRWMLGHLAIPAADPFSFTLRDAPWTAHEWLSEVILAGAHAAGGWAAVVLLAAAAFAITLALLSRFLLRYLEALHVLLLTAMSASLLAPHLSARPHALMAPLLVAWTIGLLRAREQRAAPPWMLALGMLVWANLHGSFVVGLALAIAFAMEAVADSAPGAERRDAARRWTAFLGVSALAAIATPFGAKGLLFAFELERMGFALSVIDEWRPVDFQQLHPLELWLLLAVGAILLRGLILPPIRVVLLLGLLHLALKHGRHADLLALLAPLIVASPFSVQLSAARAGALQAIRIDRQFAALVPAARPAIIVLTLALLAAAGLLSVRADAVRPAPEITPAAAVHAVRGQHLPGQVFNAYEFGGYLIFSGIAPFIDGRTDLYGDAFVKAYADAIDLRNPELLPQLLEKHRIGWTLLPPAMPAVSRLDRLPGWRRIYADETAVVHARESALR